MKSTSDASYVAYPSPISSEMRVPTQPLRVSYYGHSVRTLSTSERISETFLLHYLYLLHLRVILVTAWPSLSIQEKHLDLDIVTW